MAGRLAAFVRLDFGLSAISGSGAAEELLVRVPVTLTLLLLGLFAAIVFGVPLGLLLSSGGIRRATAPIVQVVSALPVFCSGLALAYLARTVLGWPAANGTFPSVSQLLHPDESALRIVLLPAVTIGLAGVAAVQVALRRSASDIQDAPFHTGLRRLGLSTLEIDRIYVAPIVFSGLFTSLGEVALALFSAAVVSEWVFRCPGAADLFVKSVALHDWNVVALILFFFAATVQLANFVGRVAAEAVVGAGHKR
ncbi:MAG TPA: ABC transporter permease subunit [Rhizomicrobium sp.]|nr:ABC transporter permease subunit [Rhizomicrobium sp.]